MKDDGMIKMRVILEQLNALSDGFRKQAADCTYFAQRIEEFAAACRAAKEAQTHE